MNFTSEIVIEPYFIFCLNEKTTCSIIITLIKADEFCSFDRLDVIQNRYIELDDSVWNLKLFIWKLFILLLFEWLAKDYPAEFDVAIFQGQEAYFGFTICIIVSYKADELHLTKMKDFLWKFTVWQVSQK